MVEHFTKRDEHEKCDRIRILFTLFWLNPSCGCRIHEAGMGGLHDSDCLFKRPFKPPLGFRPSGDTHAEVRQKNGVLKKLEPPLFSRLTVLMLRCFREGA